MLVRLIPWFRTKFMWTLRNRLIVAYVFIAVVPVILLLSMAGLATYGLYLQLGAHVFQDDLQRGSAPFPPMRTPSPALSRRKRPKAPLPLAKRSFPGPESRI